MRTYPQDSPQAAARIVAMAALADGHLCSTEAEKLNLSVSIALKLQKGEWHTVLRDYCEDRLATSNGRWSSLTPDDPMIATLLGEIQDPELRRTIVCLCAVVTEADSHRADAESVVMQVAAAQWGVTRAEVGPA
jgi:hypothetical protein